MQIHGCYDTSATVTWGLKPDFQDLPLFWKRAGSTHEKALQYYLLLGVIFCPVGGGGVTGGVGAGGEPGCDVVVVDV